MKAFSATLLSIAILLGAGASTSLYAGGGRAHHGGTAHHFRSHHFPHHSRAHVGVFIGAPLFYSPWYYPAYYPAPYYYYPPAVGVPASPPVYIEQGQAAAPDPQAYWYYCRESQTYYPYVKECAGPWQRVVPQPPPS